MKNGLGKLEKSIFSFFDEIDQEFDQEIMKPVEQGVSMVVDAGGKAVNEGLDWVKENVIQNQRPTGVAAGIKYCAYCGKQNPIDAKFCAHCGEKAE